VAEQMSGFVAEVGGEEIGRNGNAKPRKIVVKESLDAQYGKTFRVWQDSSEFDTLAANNGKYVTVIYEVQEREGGPQGKYTQNFILGVDAPDSGDGAGSSAPSSGTTWEQAPSDGWATPPATTSTPAPSPEPSKRDETTRQIEAAWALGCLLQFEEYRKDPDLLKKKTHQLIALKHQIASELS
jgi:hypothetical protein